MDTETQKLQEDIRTLTQKVQALERLLTGTRVQIEAFEGLFKTFTSLPTGAFPDGALFFYDDGSTQKIYARINATWREVTLT